MTAVDENAGLATRLLAGRRPMYLALALALAFSFQCLMFARANGQTYDEGVTLAAGVRLLDTGVDDVNREHPPLAKAIIALPVWLFASPDLDRAFEASRGESSFGLGRALLYDTGADYQRLLWLGRAPTMLLALFLVGLTGLFAHRLWGPRAGLLAVGLAAFDPNLVAHGSLMGLDLPLTLWVTGAFFGVSELIRTRRVAWLVLAGAMSGLALATKHSGPLYVIVACGALLAQALQKGGVAPWWDVASVSHTRLRALAHALGNALLLLGVAFLLLRLTLWRGGYAAYMDGARAQLVHQSSGHPAFFLGEISRGGWVAYFPVALLMKLPPLTLACALVSLLAFRRGAPWSRAIAVVALPLAALLGALLFARIDIGVRYALPLWPLLIVAASRVATFDVPRWPKVVLAIGALHHVVAALRVAPHQLAFFSDVVGGPSRGHRYLADSNLDWGQDIRTLGKWLAEHERPRRLYLAYFGSAEPRAYGVSYRPAPNSCPHPAPWKPEPEPGTGRELLAVSAMNLQGVFFGDTRAYAWLGARRPVAVLGHSISVYDITDDAAAHRALSEMYQRYGPAELAPEETARATALESGAK